MSLDQLRSFVSVADEGSVGRAAQKLCLTQPPVSRQISHLEDELGTPLFARVARGMTLTEAGARLLPHARRILDDVGRCEGIVQMGSHAGVHEPPQTVMHDDTDQT